MVTDVTLFREFANNYGFYYYQTRESLDFQNLIDEAFRGVYLIHAQGRININQNANTGFFINKTYTGRMYFGVPSNIDGVIYNDKYDKFVYNIDRLEINKLLISYFCKDHVFELSNAQPFYNLFAMNFDGISYDYEITIDNDASDLTLSQKLSFINLGFVEE